MKPPPSSIPRLALTIREAAATLGIAPSSLYRVAREGGVALTRVGGRTLVKVEDLDLLLEAGKAAPSSLKGQAATAVRKGRDSGAG